MMGWYWSRYDSGVLLGERLATTSTVRNWRTVLKLIELTGA